MANAYPRINIYLDNPRLHEIIHIAVMQRGITLSAYCMQAIRSRLQEDGLLSAADIEANRQTAPAALDHLRQQVGPIGVPVRELVAVGRVR